MHSKKTDGHRLSWLYKKHFSSRSIKREKEHQDEDNSPRTVLRRRIDFRLRAEMDSLENTIRHSPRFHHEMARHEAQRTQGQHQHNMAFLTACRQQEYDEAMALLNKDHVDMDDQDVAGMAASHFAAWHGNLSFLEMLLDNATNPNLKGFEGRSPLHFAAMFDKGECVQLLARKGADVDQIDDYHWTPLHYASASDSPSAATALMAAGAKLTEEDDFGFTAGQLAASEEIENIIPKNPRSARSRKSCSGARGNSLYYKGKM